MQLVVLVEVHGISLRTIIALVPRRTTLESSVVTADSAAFNNIFNNNYVGLLMVRRTHAHIISHMWIRRQT